MKFKKHISFLLAILLLVSNIGFAIDVHYCGDKIATIKPVYWKNTTSLLAKEDGCHPLKSASITQKKESCCKDKLIRFEEKSENVMANSLPFHSDFNFVIEEWNPIFFFNSSYFESSRIISYYCDANAPPLFKLYHQYIFYA